MPIEVDLKPEDVERLVKDSIMASGFGAAVKKAMDGLFTGYNNPLENQLKNFAAELMKQLLKEQFGEQIRIAVVAEMTRVLNQETIDTVVKNVVDKFYQEIKSSY